MGYLKKGVLSFAAIIALAGVGSFFLMSRPKEKAGTHSAAQTAYRRGSADLAAPGAIIDDLHGFIVWSTNRYGNHELVRMSLSDRHIVRLTDNPLADTFPRIAPDGRTIVFTRSQRTGVSQRDPLPWDIWLLDLSHGTETLLVKNGYAPSWSDNGDAIYFQRHGDSVCRYDLASRRVAEIYTSGRSVRVAPGVTLGMPSWSDTDRAMAVTFRDGLDATGIIKANGDILLLGGGCQMQWSPGGGWLYYVDHDWKRNNIFSRINFKTRKKVLLFDSPAAFSHEYFPRFDRSGNYLIYGASTGGHELDQADYVIFLWRVGSRFDSAVRLTFNPANDCWPDIFLRETALD